MNNPPLKNLPASVHQRLMNEAKRTTRPFNELLQYFSMERFLYRLSRSPYAPNFILKGALMMCVWEGSSLPRPTLDIDLLGRRINNAVDSLVRVIGEVCDQRVEPDGLVFDRKSVEGVRIAQGVGHEGVRVRFTGSLGKARINMQLDVGFGDVVVPDDELLNYPTILDFPAPRLRGYTRESTVAEKLEAAMRYGALNSRMKDFFDIWWVSRQFEFDGATLAEAIKKTFANRGSEIVPEPLPLTAAFGEDQDRKVQWRAFRRKSRLEFAPEDLQEVTTVVATFLKPVVAALASNQSFRAIWTPPGPWSQAP